MVKSLRTVYALLLFLCVQSISFGQIDTTKASTNKSADSSTDSLKTVSGKILDKKDNQPIIGAVVMIKGTTKAAVTDIDGLYKLEIPKNNATLVISYLGYKPIEINPNTTSSFDFSLEEDQKVLSEVIVTAIAIKREKKEIGYSLQEVKTQEILDSRETNIVNALNSKVAGVQVTSSSGSPGASSRIRLRGSTSITQNNDPLFVVDGIPIDNTGGNRTESLESSNRGIDINPDDIATMTVLKGPAATALYGIRAANGAVIITTKTGQNGKTIVNFTSSFGIDQVNKLPEKQDKFAGGNNGIFVPNYLRDSKGSSAAWGPEYGDPTLPAGVQFYDNPSKFFTTGTQRNNYVSISGGNEKTTNYLSFGNFKQTGIVPNQDFERTTFKISNTNQVAKFVKLSSSLTYNYSTATRLRKGGDWSAPMIALYRGASDYDYSNGYSDPVNTPDAYLLPEGHPIQIGSITQYQKTGSVYDNPYFSINNNKNTEVTNRLIGYFQGDFTITKWLTGMARVGTDVYSTGTTENFDKRSAESIGHKLSFIGSRYESQLFKRDINTDLMLNAQHKINKDFDVGLRLGHNYWTSYRSKVGVAGNNYLFNDIPDFSAITPIYTIEDDRIKSQSLMATYLDAKVGFREYAFLNFTGRFEQASTVPKNNNTFFFPALNASLVFSDMLNISNGPILTFGRVRAAWAQVGNMPNPYLTNTYYGPLGNILGQSPYVVNSILGNPSIQPEISTTQEYGTDLKFFQKRLGLDFTYYNTVNSNQIVPADIAPSLGFSSAWLNSGRIRNSGIEIVATGTPIKRKVIWDASINFTRQRTIVEEVSGNFQYVGNGAGFNNGSNVGIPGYQYGMLTSSSRLMRYGQDPNDLTIRNDLPIVVDANGQPMVEGTSINGYIIGNPNPDWFAGIRNTLTYKSWYFSFLWDIRKGGDIINITRNSMSYFGQSKETENRNDASIYPNSVFADGTPNTIAIKKDASFYSRLSENGNVGELWIEDGSWYRLREATLKYNFPEAMLKKYYMRNLSLSFTARNLLLFTKYKGVDPETNAAGNDPSLGKDAYNMPNTRSYSLTLSVMF